MLTIRMRRVGAKKKPLFRVIVTEARSAPDGDALEVLGHYNPTAVPETIEVDRQRLRYWVDRGAQLSDTVRTLVARHPDAPAEPAAEEAAPEPAAEPAAPADAAAETVDEAAEVAAEPATDTSETAEEAAETAEAEQEEPAAVAGKESGAS